MKDKEIDSPCSLETQESTALESEGSPPVEAEIPRFEVNTKAVLLYTFCMAVNMICVAWTTGGMNQVSSVIAAKLGWTLQETQVKNSLINCASQMGKAAGAMYGGRIIQSSRKGAYRKYNILAMVSCLAMQYLSFPVLFACKFLNGFFVTVIHINSIKMLNETIPVYMLQKYGLATGVLGCFGYLLVLGLGLGLPSADYNPELTDDPVNLAAKEEDIQDQFWRVMFVFPFVVECLMLHIFESKFCHEPIMFSVRNNLEAEAKALIRTIYQSDEDQVYDALQRQCHQGESQETQQQESFWQSLFGERHWRTTLVGMAFASFSQQNACNVFNMFSNRVVTSMNKDLPRESQVPANMTTQILGLISLVGGLCSILALKRFRKKDLLTWGAGGMGCSLLLMSLMIYLKKSIPFVAFMVLYSLSLNMSMNPIHWLYLPEILTDSQLGFISTVHYSNAIEITLVSEKMMEKLKPEGMFFFYGTVTVLSTLFFEFVVKETEGLTDREKKDLYLPDHLRLGNSPDCPDEVELGGIN